MFAHHLSPPRTETATRGREDLARLAGDALSHLYDLPYLQMHPLLHEVALTPRSGSETAGKCLQRTLLEVVEALGPSRREAAERVHRILVLRYVDGVEIAAIQRELAIGRSQYYREHQKALDGVASLLWERYGLHQDVPRPSPMQVPGPPNLRSLTNGGVSLVAPPPLPIPLTSFVGRGREMRDIARLLETSRLLTLTGPPGAGKTRLALEAAAQNNARFADGVYFVPLAPLTDPALVVPAIAQSLGVREQGSRTLEDSLVAALRDQAVLLVLDNLEQVVEASPAIARLLQACPSVQALATSRIRLHVSGEQEFPVPSLELNDLAGDPAAEGLGRDVPSPDARPHSAPYAPAVELFLDRARLVNPDLRPTLEDVEAIKRICVGLDGLPLAIELAAARSNLLPPHALAARLSSRLSLLTDGPRDLPARHQTLRAAITWSYDLLTASEQLVFEQLSVFAGGWTLEAAEAVCRAEGATILDCLAALVDGSLVRRELEADGTARFSMLESVRELAAERLAQHGQEFELRERFADYFLAFTLQWGASRGVPRLASELRAVAGELDNLRSTLDWLEHQDAERGLRLMSALGHFWNIYGHRAEGHARMGALLAAGGSSRRTTAGARVLIELAHLDMLRGDLDSAIPLLHEALAIQRDVHDLRGILRSYWLLGRMALRRRATVPLGAALIEHSLAIARALGDREGITHGLTSFGQALRIAGDAEGARVCWEECRDQHLEGPALGGTDGVPVLCHLAGLAIDRADPALARSLLEQAFFSPSDMGDVFATSRALEVAGALAASLEGEAAAMRALRLVGAAAALREKGAVPLTWYQKEEVDRWLAPARALLGDRANDSFAAGRLLSLDEAIAEVLAPS